VEIADGEFLVATHKQKGANEMKKQEDQAHNSVPIIKPADINAKFSSIVAGYLSKGYVLNSGTMGGSSAGELCHVDVTDGKEVLRVSVATFTASCESRIKIEGVEVVVERVIDHVTPNSLRHDFVGKCETIHQDRFYSLCNFNRADAYTTNLDHACAAEKKRHLRCRHRTFRVSWPCFVLSETFDSPGALDIAKKFIQKKTGLSRVQKSKIKIQKIHDNDKHAEYRISYQNKAWDLRVKNADCCD
jgi:hypothetical protein